MLQTYIPYAMVAVLSVAALLHFSANIYKYEKDTKQKLFFIIAILSMAICSAMEFCFTFHESGIITNLVFCYATEVCYSCFSLLSAFFWCMSSEISQEAWITRTKKRIICATVPFAIMELAVLSTPLTHIVFYFTEEGHYVRGLLNNVLVYLSAICIAKSGICALIKSLQSKYYLNRALYRTFFYYALGILIAQLLQIVLGSILPFRIIGAVFVFYLVQEHTFKQHIFVDVLSEANNRSSMEHYLKNHFSGADERFAFAMIDLDSFKYINDHYGHSTGDKAIAMIAKGFKMSLPEHLFFGRFGGDEFVIIGRAEWDKQIDSVIELARKNIAALAKKQGFAFCPDFSYGVAYKTRDITSVPALINRADEAMYENKKARKAVMKENEHHA